MAQSLRTGPLNGIKIIELAGLGPAPYASMMLADAGAQVIRLERAAPGAPERAAEATGSYWNLLNRSRISVGIDLKHEEAVELVLSLVERADGLIEGFRPGVAENLGLGPDACLARNRALVYGRMTGWGQDGPMAHMAGHDIDYIAIGGALWAMGRAGSPPVPPMNLVGDFGGGGMLLAFGMVSALLESSRSGEGQVVDVAMVDGVASLMTMVYAFHGAGVWSEDRASNVLDTGAPFYEVYETSDGKYFAVGSIESDFYAELLEGLGLANDPDFVGREQNDKRNWPRWKERYAAVFATKTRDEWTAIFDGTDACAVPVLSPWEAHLHPHNQERGTFVEVDGRMQAAPTPRFSRTPSSISKPPSFPGADTVSGLIEWGIDEETVAALRQTGVLS
jgi:alpha-methylacyl-CoA racemase